jgi:cytidylate kinase
MTWADVWWFIAATGLLFWLIPIACGVAGAAIAVGVIGPRERDSLILPGMAGSAASFVALFELDGWAWMAGSGVLVATITAAAQRWALARLDRSSPSWPRVAAGLTVLAGALVGGFFGYLAARTGDLELILVGACLGAAAGAAATLRWGRTDGDPGWASGPVAYPRVVPTAHRGLIVALDGPGSSGKSSVGAAAALELGYRFCDTGLLYRAATWLSLERRVPPSEPAGLVALVPEIALVADDNGRLAHVTVDGTDVTDDVHTPRVDEAVSAISGVGELRRALLQWQRDLAHASGGIIMAGRDIGTVVLPDADLKIFLDASVQERARRRMEERGVAPDSEEARFILAQLRRRDELDSTRAVAPLRPADDAVHIVTDGNRFEETVAAVVREIRAAEARAGAEAVR